MQTFSKAPIKVDTTKEEFIVNKIQRKMDTEKLHHKEDLLHPGIKVYFLVIVSCNNFGHRARDCNAYGGKAQENGGVHLKYNVKCYKCHNYGHIARDCRSMIKKNIECFKCHNYGHIARDCINNMAIY